jgi:hypothetical protein
MDQLVGILVWNVPIGMHYGHRSADPQYAEKLNLRETHGTVCMVISAGTLMTRSYRQYGTGRIGFGAVDPD